MNKQIKHTNRYLRPSRGTQMILCGAALLVAPLGFGQEDAEEEIFELSPFEVTADEREGYQAVDTLAGNRLNTKLRDVGNAISVVTTQFLEDTGATDNQSLLQYTVGTEVGGMESTFAGFGDGALLDESNTFINPNANTRVRGLTDADNTRNFFVSDIPWDSYNVDRVELQRGPNSILFGQGSPSGLINVGLKGAAFENEGQVEVQFDEHGGTRLVLDLNKVIIEDELAMRFSVLRNAQKYQQDPAFRDDDRFYTALRWDPKFMNSDSVRTSFKANYEDGQIESNNPRTLAPIDRITPWFLTGTYQGSFVENGNILDVGADPIDPSDNTRIDVSYGDPRTYQHLNKATFNAHQLQQDNNHFPNHGQGRPKVNGGPFSGAFSPYYVPGLDSFAGNFGGPAHYGEVDGTIGQVWSNEISGARGINTEGNRDGGIGFHFHRPMSIAPTSVWAKNAGVPFGQFGIFKNNSITDPSIFDFYNNLLDGPNKKEWQNFNALNMSFSQTYLNDKIGFDVTYNKQDYDNGQLSLLSGSEQAISIDIMEVYPDGNANTYEGLPDIPYDNGTPNPYVGRPYISDNGNGGNNSFKSSRESIRVTPFVKYDFTQGDGNVLTNILGSGTFTGLYSEDKLDRENRSWNQYAILDESYINFIDPAGQTNFASGFLTPSNVIYLGPSLMDKSSAAGANLSRVMAKVDPPANGTVRVFDSTWKHPLDPSAAGYVNPADPWIRNDNLPPELHYPDYDPSRPEDFADPRLDTQSNNPANYVGWVDRSYTLTRSEDNPEVNRELLATNAALEHTKTESQALIWQGHLWENSLVGTFGWRKDTVSGAEFRQNMQTPANQSNFGYLNFDPSVYRLYTAQEIEDGAAAGVGTASTSGIEVQSRSYSIVAHLAEMPVLKGLFDNSPVSVSLFYNNSTNFQPESSRVDIYGERHPAPDGETIDRGILIQSKNGRYTFKVNKYKTVVQNATTTGLSTGFLGTSQQYGGNWTNQYEYDFSIDNQSYIWTHMATDRPAGSPYPPNYDESKLLLDRVAKWTDVENNYADGTTDSDAQNQRASLYNFGTSGDAQTAELAMAKEAKAIADWRAWQASVDPRYYAAWGIDLDAPFRADNPQGLTASAPNGFSVVEDATSEGTEFEFTMRPTDNWNIMINASQTEAVRSRVGSANLIEFVEGYNNAVNNTGAGDIRIWWGGSGNESTLFQWNKDFYSEWVGRKQQEGGNVPELREWRVNLITNYDFTDGRFKGFSVGGGLRYQDSVIIGYRPTLTSEGTLAFDLNDPRMGPSETYMDLWLGYGRELSDKLDWRVQLNVRNAFEGDGLIPVTVQPDGTPAGYRIAPSETWYLRNTFSF